ncbi:Hypothetical predicted protein [Olea europaea subsp. europaea]|uniref:Uncharacterized protein n=1 Tax=Olea europaea subsp. europaea TaxID=158383 RepID=A0A8S0RCV1_OLEEU|nr:Hypothetical predicted protein [Olea europaea subsp. europaea]
MRGVGSLTAPGDDRVLPCAAAAEPIESHGRAVSEPQLSAGSPSIFVFCRSHKHVVMSPKFKIPFAKPKRCDLVIKVQPRRNLPFRGHSDKTSFGIYPSCRERSLPISDHIGSHVVLDTQLHNHSLKPRPNYTEHRTTSDIALHLLFIGRKVDLICGLVLGVAHQRPGTWRAGPRADDDEGVGQWRRMGPSRWCDRSDKPCIPH